MHRHQLRRRHWITTSQRRRAGSLLQKSRSDLSRFLLYWFVYPCSLQTTPKYGIPLLLVITACTIPATVQLLNIQTTFDTNLVFVEGSSSLQVFLLLFCFLLAWFVLRYSFVLCVHFWFCMVGV